jgi:glutathione peroxidase
MKSIYEFKVLNHKGEEVSMEDYKGKVLLIVNTASKCGFTNQYAGLQDLYNVYNDRGLEILAFPCNQFGNQEDGSNNEIQAFCQNNFGLTFPVYAKIDVNGETADPLFKYLKEEQRGLLGSEIRWNFTKFLVDRDGKITKRFAPMVKPKKIEPSIKKLIVR